MGSSILAEYEYFLIDEYLVFDINKKWADDTDHWSVTFEPQVWVG